MNPLARLVRRLGHERWFATVMKRVAPRMDRLAHRLSGGRVQLANMVIPTVMLVHRGRRSGRTYRTPLTYVRTPDGGWAIAGTNFGQTHAPAWAANLAADPQVQVEHKGRLTAVGARPATTEEREELWPRFLRVWPAYDTYAQRAHRDIPIFVLEPR